MSYLPTFRERPLPPSPPIEIARAPRPWLTRGEDECAFPVDGEGWTTRSCCNPCGAEIYCRLHRAMLRRPQDESLEELARAVRCWV